jgi:hypothetical protein
VFFVVVGGDAGSVGVAVVTGVDGVDGADGGAMFCGGMAVACGACACVDKTVACGCVIGSDGARSRLVMRGSAMLLTDMGTGGNSTSSTVSLSAVPAGKFFSASGTVSLSTGKEMVLFCALAMRAVIGCSTSACNMGGSSAEAVAVLADEAVAVAADACAMLVRPSMGVAILSSLAARVFCVP